MYISRRFLAGGLALAMLASACSDDLSQTADGSGAGSSGGDTNSAAEQTITLSQGEFSLTSGLATFGDCDALLTHLQTEGAQRVTAWGFNDGGYWGGGLVDDFDVMEDEEEAMEDDAASDAVNSSSVTESAGVGGDAAQFVEGEDFSGTNNQERGVDEPDIVKTDGARILTVTNGQFTYTDANDGDPERRGSLMVGYSVQDMLVSGNRVFLFGMSYGEDEGGDIALPQAASSASDVSGGDSEADFASDVDVVRFEEPHFYTPRVRIIELDISNPDDIEPTNQLLVDGFYLSARLVDGRASVAIQSDPRDLGFLFPQGQSGEDRALEANREIVGDTELTDWLPGYILDLNGQESTGQLTNCTQVHAPSEFAGFGSLSVFAFDADTGLDTPAAASVLASGQNVYASPEAMWISTNQWIDWASLDDAGRRAREESFSTQIHGFSINTDTPAYVASGTVRGHLLNQFAMSQQGDVLRVASTDGSIWGANNDSESFITTLTIDGTELVETGQVGNMGRGERIFSVRFVGNTAYVVTFRQTDPFYTVDLTDPANPEVLGELKITGYSGQLHPLTDTLILGIGQEATEEGRATGAKITLFDVSDLNNPIDLDTWTAPNSWTGAEWDHKAFLWWPQESLAVLPIQNYQEQFWGAVAFRIDAEEGAITEAGRISHEPDQDGVIGATDCTVVDAEDLEQYRGGRGDLAALAEESFWIAEQGGQIQFCGEGESGANGLFCDRMDWFDVSEIGTDDVIEMCWPEGPGSDPVIRTLVIGDTLWSLSYSRLQANNLQTFEAGPFVEIAR